MPRHPAESVSPTDRTISGAGVADKRGMASGAAIESEGVAKEMAIDDETRKPPVARRPYTPTAAEVEAHLPLHLKYRSWCPHCVAGKGFPRSTGRAQVTRRNWELLCRLTIAS